MMSKRTRKLSPDERHNLIKAIMDHRHVTSFVRTGTDLYALRSKALIDLATKLGMDAEEAIAIDRKFSGLLKYTFHGVIPFDLDLSLFGHTVKRKARVVFGNTPDWATFNPETGAEELAKEQSTLHLEILAKPDGSSWSIGPDGKSMKDANEPRWLLLDILESGVLPEEIHFMLDDLIDNHCREIDNARRKAIIQN
jgi:hypothetical protein